MKRFATFFIILLFGVITFFITRPYFLQHKVLFPGNLLVSFYEPYNSYPWAGYPNGPANKPMGFDALRIFYPVRLLTTEALKEWSLPLWNPYYFAGNTLLGTYQSAVFHPLTPLFLFLPPIDAWSIVIILQPFLASIFTYLFLRSLFFSKKISLLGGVLFGFSGIVIVLMEESFMALYSGLFLPLILYSITEFFLHQKKSAFLLLCMSLTASIISGWFQMTLYVFAFALSWTIYLFFKSSNRRALFFSLIAFPIALCISAIHLIPGMEAFMYSARGTTDAKYLFDTYLVSIAHLITYIAPDFWGNPGAYNYFGTGFYYEKMLYIGIVGIFFALYALFIKSTGKSMSVFFKYTWLITLSLGISLPTSWLLLYYFHLPFLSTILPSRIFFLSTFASIILACYGVEEYLKRPNKKLVMTLFSIFLVVIVIGGMFAILQKHFHPSLKEYSVSLRNLIIPGIMVVAVSITAFLGAYISSIKKYIVFALIFISTIGSVLFAQKYLFFSDRTFTFPTVPVLSQLQQIIGNNRFLSLGSGTIEDNFNIAYKLQSAEGYDSFFIQRYGELVYAANNKGKYSSDISRADVSFAASNILNLIKNPYQSKIVSLLGIHYFVEKTQDSKKETFSRDVPITKIWTDGKFDIYSYNNSFPRAFLVDSYKTAKTNRQIIKHIFNNNTNLKKTVILETQPVDFTINKILLKGNAIITSYKPESVRITVHANKSTILFLSDTYFPGWHAYVDGKEKPVYRTDYAFRSVVVPEGIHQVRFEYKPLSVLLGWIASGIGVIAMILVYWKIGYTKRRQ